jgi:hypothetical protein
MVTRRARIYRARELCCLDVDTLRWPRKRAEKGMKPEFIFPTFRLNDSYLCSLHVRAISQKRDDHQICLSLYLGTLLWLSNVSVTLASNLNLSWLIEPVLEFSFKKRNQQNEVLTFEMKTLRVSELPDEKQDQRRMNTDLLKTRRVWDMRLT